MAKKKTKTKELVIHQCPSCAKAYKTERGMKSHIALTHQEKSITEWLKDGNIVLKIKEELFCQYYIMNAATRGNGTVSYSLAYGIDLDSLDTENRTESKWDPKVEEVVEVEIPETSERAMQEKVCATSAVRLLRKAKVDARLVQLRNLLLTDEIVDGELSKVIMQKDERSPTKIAGIKEHNALRQRVVKKEEINLKTIGIVKLLYQKADEIEEEENGNVVSEQ